MEVRDLFGALADPLRFRIVELLRTEPRFVSELVEATGAPQPNVSRHLKALRESGLIAGRRQGKWIRYRILPEALAEIRRWSEAPPPAAKRAAPAEKERTDPDDYLFT